MMTKQRRSFFVDDILQMTLPVKNNFNFFDGHYNKLKRKLSTYSHNDISNENDELSNKKIRYHCNEDNDCVDKGNDDNYKSNYFQ